MKSGCMTVADLRADIARRRILRYRLAANVHVHPSRLAAMLNETVPMPSEVAARVAAAIENWDDSSSPGPQAPAHKHGRRKT